MPRIYTPAALATGLELALDPASARHIQVLRLQPGGMITLFNGQGGEYAAEVTHMGRSEVRVRLGVHNSVEREAARAVHVAIGMPANERMEWLIEKATELGVASIQPLMTERTVLRLSGERAEKKQTHWQGIAASACEQSGRNRVPTIYPVQTLQAWLQNTSQRNTAHKGVFSLHSASLTALAFAQVSSESIECLCGPEGGLSAAEESAAMALGYAPVGLGQRVLRSETAPLVALSLWA